jgi:chromosome segregation ATPase
MKTLIKLNIWALLIVVAFCACNGNSALKEQWTAERDSLMDINNHQRQVLDEMTSAIVEISNILDTINMQERILFSSHDIEGRRYTRKQVVENLRIFENILKEKRMRIHYLDSLMNKNDERIRQLSSLVSYLNSELDKKDSIIKVLRADVKNKNYDIKTLNEKISSINEDMEQLTDSLTSVNEKSTDMENVIKKQEEELYAVYYIIGTKKELTSKGVLTGGNLFKKSKVNASAISAATKADSRNITTIEISGEKPSVLTDIPSNCYRITKISNKLHKLEILDKKQFWSVSKLLIIQVK